MTSPVSSGALRGLWRKDAFKTEMSGTDLLGTWFAYEIVIKTYNYN